jgi:putative transposase
VADIFIACVDRLKGFPEAVEAIYPETQMQICLVQLVHHSLCYVSHKDRKEVATDLKRIYQAAALEEAELELYLFEQNRDKTYPVISRSWRCNWIGEIPMFSYPAEIRKTIYTTNMIESLNMTLRKIIKNRLLFPNDEAIFKLMYLSLKNISKKWTMPIQNWSAAMDQFAIMFEGSLPKSSFDENSFIQNF